jgi:hypothetical protein
MNFELRNNLVQGSATMSNNEVLNMTNNLLKTLNFDEPQPFEMDVPMEQDIDVFENQHDLLEEELGLSGEKEANPLKKKK